MCLSKTLEAPNNKSMCGRYVSKIDADLERHFNLTKVPFDFSSYNVAPGRNVPVVRGAETGERELVLMRWGLIPGQSHLNYPTPRILIK